MSTKLPEFERPPVVEVAISIQFDSPVLDGPQVMLRWSEIRDRFPKYQIAQPMPRTTEQFDGGQGPAFEIQFGNAPVTPQLLMMTESGEKALQLQADRIGYTWRKLGKDDVYPSYSQLKEQFQQELEGFRTYISEQGLGELLPVQCELTYVDAIFPQPGVWDSHSELGKVIPSAAPRLTEGFLPPPETTNYTTKYIIPSENDHPAGRLHVTIEPRIHNLDESHIYLMTTTARGVPGGVASADIFDTLDLWHYWILRAFVDLTSFEIHQAWGRTT